MNNKIKLCIVSAVNYRHMTMVSIYLDYFKKNNIECDIIWMDKYLDGIDNVPYGNSIVHKKKISKNDFILVKLYRYYSFKRKAISLLLNNNYDLVIVWNDIAIFLLGLFLSRKYKNKYILNIRDYLYQNHFFLIKWIYDKSVSNSIFTTISSDGFRLFLPKKEYITLHSLNKSMLEKFKKKTFKSNSTIRITFIGLVRFFENDKKLLNLFANDTRFKINYFGTNSHKLKIYCSNNKITNVSFVDSFPVHKTIEYLEQSDLINNLYGNDCIDLTQALSIKLYYGVYCRIPILVNKNTYGATLINKYKIGYIVDELSVKTKNNIYLWYKELNFDLFNSGCEKFLEKINYDNTLFYNKLNNAIKNGKN